MMSCTLRFVQGRPYRNLVNRPTLKEKKTGICMFWIKIKCLQCVLHFSLAAEAMLLTTSTLPYQGIKAVPEKRIPLVNTYVFPHQKARPCLVHLRRTPNASQLLGPLPLTSGKSLASQSIREISNMRSDKEPERPQ